MVSLGVTSVFLKGQESSDEGAADIFLRALWAQGLSDEAIRFYRDFEIQMERELNLPPGHELVRTLELTAVAKLVFGPHYIPGLCTLLKNLFPPQLIRGGPTLGAQLLEMG